MAFFLHRFTIEDGTDRFPKLRYETIILHCVKSQQYADLKSGTVKFCATFAIFIRLFKKCCCKSDFLSYVYD